eukprot:3050125-Pyramimonas_sp.AAC.1
MARGPPPAAPQTIWYCPLSPEPYPNGRSSSSSSSSSSFSSSSSSCFSSSSSSSQSRCPEHYAPLADGALQTTLRPEPARSVDALLNEVHGPVVEQASPIPKIILDLESLLVGMQGDEDP